MIENSQNRVVQNLTTSLLKVFIQICEDNHLRYYFTGGALIGVLRHGGFVPWDDDVDIGMPRADYDRFIALSEISLPEGYGICNRDNTPDWNFDMSQFFDKESEIEIHLAEQTRRAHIWIDVFPLDGLPGNGLSRWLRVKRILYYRYLIQLAHIHTQVDAKRSRPFVERLVLNFFRVIPLGKLLNTDKLLSKLEKELKKTDFDEAKYAGNMLGRYREREVVPKEYFGKAKTGNFESLKVNIPAESDKLQTAIYGEYMSLPPKNKRVAHNVVILTQRDI